VAAPSSVFTMARVAEMLGEDEDWLSDVALGMEPEDGCLAVYDVNDQGTTAFTLVGIENLKELIEIHKANPWIIKRYRYRNSS
jgi:hypothetical protein